MAVTKTWEGAIAARLESGARPVKPIERRQEFLWLSAASVVVICGLAAVLAAKTQDFSALRERLKQGELLDVNRIGRPEQLLPALDAIPDSAERMPSRTRFTLTRRIIGRCQISARLPICICRRLRPRNHH